MRFEGILDLPYPDRRTKVIRESGHMVHFEAPAALADAAETFFASIL